GRRPDGSAVPYAGGAPQPSDLSVGHSRPATRDGVVSLAVPDARATPRRSRRSRRGASLVLRAVLGIRPAWRFARPRHAAPVRYRRRGRGGPDGRSGRGLSHRAIAPSILDTTTQP